MTRISLRSAVFLLAASGALLAQPSAPATTNNGWRAADAQEQAAQDQSAPPATQQQDQAASPRDAYGQPQAPAAAQPPAAQRPSYGLPAEVTLKPGSMISVRINQKLESNKNAVGDTFSGTLLQPVVVNGIVVAPRGQMVFGRVAESSKVKGMSRLGIELTALTLADGTSAPIHSQWMSRQSAMLPYGHHDEGVITTATADGSAAAAGAPAIGVLATKGHNSVVYPESVLTFQTGNAVTIATSNANAYRYVSPDDYSRPANMTTRVATRPAYAYGPGYPYYGYPYWGYPYWGPVGIGFGFGGFWGGGFRGRFR
jgi:hypothetical protein